jgi:hypothetical protein
MTEHKHHVQDPSPRVPLPGVVELCLVSTLAMGSRRQVSGPQALCAASPRKGGSVRLYLVTWDPQREDRGRDPWEEVAICEFCTPICR